MANGYLLAPRDDGDVNSMNDTWNSNCECIGIQVSVDCAGVPGGGAFMDECGTCAGGSTGVLCRTPILMPMGSWPARIIAAQHSTPDRRTSMRTVSVMLATIVCGSTTRTNRTSTAME